MQHSFSVLDQRELPARKRYLNLPDIQSACRAIRTLAVRGAPLIGVVAALSLAHAARTGASHLELLQNINALARTRPTAVNLFVSLGRMRRVIEKNSSKTRIVQEAIGLWEEEKANSIAIAEHGQGLIQSGMKVGTFCNTGVLAAPGLGTALGVIIRAHLLGKKIDVLVPETRPLLQGARLTAWELSQWKIPYTLVTESALASVVDSLDVVFVGADRIAANGDTANKVGTYGLAILARYFGIPFYVVAPSTTIDMEKDKGTMIPIEQRDASEVRRFGPFRCAPSKAKVANPAFDVTPADLITAIVTEKGVIGPPYKRNLRQ